MHTLILDLSSPGAGGSDMSGGGINGTVPVTVGLFSGPGGNSLIRTFSVTITGTGVSNTVLHDAGVTDGPFSIGLRVTPSVTAYVLGAAAFVRYTIPPVAMEVIPADDGNDQRNRGNIRH